MPVKEIAISENQKSRISTFHREIESVDKQIADLQRIRDLAQMGLTSLLSTIVECGGAVGNDEYQLASDFSKMVLVKEGGESSEPTPIDFNRPPMGPVPVEKSNLD
jgi:hypothetical protein